MLPIRPVTRNRTARFVVLRRLGKFLFVGYNTGIAEFSGLSYFFVFFSHLPERITNIVSDDGGRRWTRRE